MKEGPDIARLGSLIGDPARANMLTALMAGRALTASELALEAGISQQTASAHLRKLEDGGLLIRRKQGRHRYFALTDERVAHMIEAMMGLTAEVGLKRVRTGPKDDRMREARVCYDHLAGAAGTQLFERMVARGLLAIEGGGLGLSENGERFVADLGVDLAALRGKRSPLCRECLDWSERRSHLAGSVGRALLARFEELGWARRDGDSRAVLFSPSGRRAFDSLLAD